MNSYISFDFHCNSLISFSVTGNANFNMSQTSLTLLGFTQPQSAMPIIHNPQNNAKGFISRILWYFPKPIYSRLKDPELTMEERQMAKEGEEMRFKNIDSGLFSMTATKLNLMADKYSAFKLNRIAYRQDLFSFLHHFCSFRFQAE